MDHKHYTLKAVDRQKGKHLTFENRCEIKTLHKLGFSNRRIADYLNCSPSTISNELSRGTKVKNTHIGRPSEYSPRRGQNNYNKNRLNCGRKNRLSADNPFVKWVVHRVKSDEWSLDSCAGRALKDDLFPEDRVCTKTLYNSLHKGLIGISLFDVPEVLGRKKRSISARRNKRILGRSIDERPEIVAEGTEFGHWEIDTVVGKRAGKESVVLTLVEKMTHTFISMKINGKDADSVKAGMEELRTLYGSKYNEVFKTITSDNGAEFAELSSEEGHGVMVYFTHPYSSWERPQNERHNRIFRKYVPKHRSIENYTADQILWFSDEMNRVPRKSLGYKTAEELFEEHLDSIYAA